MRTQSAIIGLITLLCTSITTAGAADKPLHPGRHGDFGHYTLALTWQPGFCADGSCAKDQDRSVQIGLHGLWASRPQSLIRLGVQAPRWWSRGCDLYHHSDARPKLSPKTRKRLARVMPQLDPSLLTHEYDKHVQCFGFNTQKFFHTELDLRRRVATSRFGGWLRAHAGRRAAHAAVLTAFNRAFDTKRTDALQLRCSGHHGSRYLSQVWFTIPRRELAAFPQNAGLTAAPRAQHNCPASFTIPAWRHSGAHNDG